ncbi:hypothetical protein [Brevibacillus sp. NRS-1366]|uniref:hypothetical protein n=1 Tax=Brevibacillus sp. NRS-1366 TaxID=3233899 RepID=UPI003D195A29
MNLRQIPEIDEMMAKIEEVQGEWAGGKCSMKECYWNMWNPKYEYLNNDDSAICVSESLADFKMKPNSADCKGYWDYKVACGCKKGE